MNNRLFASLHKLTLLYDENFLLLQKRFVHHHKEWEISKSLYLGKYRSQPQKANRNTHINEKKFRKARALKTLYIELPDDVTRRKQENMDPDEMRIALLKKGINPFKEISPRDWNEQQLTMQSFYSLLDSYVTPEETKSLIGNFKGKKDELKDRLQHKFYNYWHGTRRIKKKVGFEKFNPKTFGSVAEQIYVSAHEALIERNKLLLHKFLTENAFAQMWPDVEKNNISWELIRFNEPSEVVSVRCADNPSKSGNDIAQLTVRMHSTQKLAIYNLFGSLILGSEDEHKDCVEYVVFENHIASVNGTWRLHDKIYPHWLKTKQGTLLNSTFNKNKQISGPTPLGLGFTKRLEDEEKKRVQDEKLGIRRK